MAMTVDDAGTTMAGALTDEPERARDGESQASQSLRGLPTISVSLTQDEEFRLVNHVKNLFYRAREKRKPLVSKWIDNYNVLRPGSWGPNRAAWQSSPEVPEIYPILATMVAWKTDQRPTFDVVPAAEPFSSYYQFQDNLARDLRVVLRANWQLESYDVELEKVVWDAEIYGVGFFKTLWDQNRQGGLGNVTMQRVDPFTLYPDPDARSFDDATYIIEAKSMAAQDVEERFPGALRRIKEERYLEESDESPTVLSQDGRGQFPRANPGAIAPATSPRYGLPGQTDRLGTDPTEDPGLTVMEAWLRVIIKDGDKRYVGWRCVVIAGNRVLMDEPADNLWSHGQHPYDRYVPHETGEFYGFSMVDMLAPAQQSINWILAAMEHNIRLVGNPVLVEDTRAGLQRTKITNKPGTRLKINAGGKAEWMTPPPLHPQLNADLIRFYISEMERISGLSAVVRGATPTGRNAEGVIDAVQEAAFVRIRLALRNLEVTLRNAGNKAAALITEFYDAPRMVALVGPSGERTALNLGSHHFYLPSKYGRLPMKFQLLIEAGSSMPTARSMRAAEADTLFAMGAIDIEAVLEAHDWPNRQAITQRVQQQQAAAGTLGQAPGARQRAGRTQ